MQQGIPLNNTAKPSGTAVKSVALATFRFLRSASDQAQKLPGLIQQTSSDIADAWRESGQPDPKR